MDDSLFLHTFKLNRDMVDNLEMDLQVLNPSSAPNNECSIFIFIHAEKARRFFQHPNHSDRLSQQNVFVFENEHIVPASMVQATDKVYLLSINSELCPRLKADDSPVPSWASGLLAALHRILVIDLWDDLKKTGFKLPPIISDDDNAARVVTSFIENDFNRYREFFRSLVRPKDINHSKAKARNILIYAPDEDMVLHTLSQDLERRGLKVFSVNYQLNWIPEIGWGKGKEKYMSDTDFARLLVEKDIHHVVFRNFYDMDLCINDRVSKIWIMRELGINAISFIVDTMIEFPFLRFRYMHWLPDNIQLISASSSESYDAFSRWTSVEKVHKCPQIVEILQPVDNQLQVKSDQPEGFIVASNARLSLVKESPLLTMLILPLVREIIFHSVSIYNTYLFLIEAVAKADRIFGTPEMIAFYHFLSRVTYTIRSLLRYSIVDEAIKIAGKKGIPLKIFGSEDWGTLFPKAYVPKYLNREELNQAYQRNIVLIPTPSTTFESQHPSITKVLLLGGRVIAPRPFILPGDTRTSTLKRFYFDAIDKMGETLSQIMDGESVTPEERDVLVETFGVQSLTSVVTDIMEENRDNQMNDIIRDENTIHSISNKDKHTVETYSNFVLALFALLYGKSVNIPNITPGNGDSLLKWVSEECSGFFSKELKEIVSSRDGYIEKIKNENDVLGKVFEAVSCVEG